MSQFLKVFLIISLAFFTGISAQEQGSTEPGKESREELDKKNAANYLEKSQYRNISFVFKDKLLEDMRLLNVVVGNFGADVSGSTESMEKIKSDYRNAVRYHYRRAYVISGKSFLETYKDTENLFQKFALVYERQADEFLIQCADELTNIEQLELSRIEPATRNSRFRELEEAKFKMKIAYFQMSQGDELIRDKRFSDSLVHFRLAKDYALKILTDLEQDETKRQSKLDENKKHLADNRNRLFAQESK